LKEFYPNTNEPAALTDLNQKAAAVQAAIWYFSDSYVLNPGGLHDAVAAIVNHVRSEGPLVQPPPPSLTITPSATGGPQNTPVGPFRVSAASTVAAVGATMFSDAGATVAIPNNSPVPADQQIWLTSTGGDTAVLLATAVATVPTGNVYLYDGNTPNVTDAQRLILAQTVTLRTTVSAVATFLPPGALTVTKTIAGPAAGQQGPITIEVTCDSVGLLQPVFTIPAGTPAGAVSHTYTGIPAQSTCVVLETADGHLPTVTARRAGSGIQVVIPPGGTATANLSDTYAVGSLIVNKTLTGSGAGQQGAVTISVACVGAPAQPNFVIPAGTPAGTVSHEYTGIPAGAACTVTETANGATSTLRVTTEGSPQTVTIAPNGSGTVNLTDVYDVVPGSLVVTKTLGGSAAGQQGLIGLLVSCGGGTAFAYLIPPATPAGSLPRVFDGIPAGSTCTVTEAINGSTTSVSVVSVGSGQQVAITPGGTGAAELTNSIEPVVAPTTPTTTPETMPETLPGTGGGGDAGNLVLIALASALTGGVLVAATRRRSTMRG
jgi:hypothetical protein